VGAAGGRSGAAGRAAPPRAGLLGATRAAAAAGAAAGMRQRALAAPPDRFQRRLCPPRTPLASCVARSVLRLPATGRAIATRRRRERRVGCTPACGRPAPCAARPRRAARRGGASPASAARRSGNRRPPAGAATSSSSSSSSLGRSGALAGAWGGLRSLPAAARHTPRAARPRAAPRPRPARPAHAPTRAPRDRQAAAGAPERAAALTGDCAGHRDRQRRGPGARGGGTGGGGGSGIGGRAATHGCPPAAR
jgi:hypothetical protein